MEKMDKGTGVNPGRTGMLHCMTSFDKETDLYISHCLNFDLIETGKNPNEAWENLKMAVKQYMEYCYANHREGFEISADVSEWKAYVDLLRTSSERPRIDEINLDLRTPLPESEYPLWMQGVLGDGSTCPSVQ